MQKDTEYKNGMAWSADEYTQCLDEQLAMRIKINMASVILVDGGQGQGKTTLAVRSLDYINKKEGFPPVDLKIKSHLQLALGGVDFISKFNKCRAKGMPGIIYDEAGDYSRASTLTHYNYQLSKVFQKVRSARMVIFICLPNFNILDNRIFDDEIIRGALHCYQRNVTVTYGNFKAYDIDQVSWLRYWFNKLPSARRHNSYDMVTSLFRSHFKNLPTSRMKDLEILSNYGKDKERQQAEINMRGLMSRYDLMRETGKSLAYIKNIITELNIQPEAKFGKKMFYSKNVLKQIENKMNVKKSK